MKTLRITSAKRWKKTLVFQNVVVGDRTYCEVWNKDAKILGWFKFLDEVYQEYPSETWLKSQEPQLAFSKPAAEFLVESISFTIDVKRAMKDILIALGNESSYRCVSPAVPIELLLHEVKWEQKVFQRALRSLALENQVKLISVGSCMAKNLGVKPVDIEGIGYAFVTRLHR